jgi:hypothetical protein
VGFPEYRRDLLDGLTTDVILDRYFHSGQSAVFYGAPPSTESVFKNEIIKALSVLNFRFHPLQVIVCGSAHLGFSPVPERDEMGDRLGRSFDPARSDIDIAVVSPELFDYWWDQLQARRLTDITRSQIANDVFWGFINPLNVRDVSKMGSDWWRIFGGLRTDRAKAIRGRVYRSLWHMQNYHRLAIDGGRDQLQGKRR